MKKKKTKVSYKDNLKTRGDEARTVRKTVSIIILLLLLIFAIGGISAYKYIKTSLEPVDTTDNEEIIVNIPMGSSSSTIGEILEEEGIIKDSRIFRFYTKFKNQSNFQAGNYTFTKAFTLDEIIESLKSGKVMAESLYTITIPEGKTIQQIAEIYSKKLPFTEEEFLEQVSNKDYLKTLIDQYSTILTDEILEDDIKEPLEGYLFASTYDFFQDELTVSTVVELMLDKTQSVVDKYRNQIEELTINGEHYTIHQALTFASLLENEERTAEERKKVAGVFYNRLEEDMMLQTDPTVAYAVGKHLSKVLHKDLEIESPYNTYKVKDLPIGPISNFNENALKAMVEPEETNFLYFLHDSDGNIHYAETYDEHKTLKEKYID